MSAATTDPASTASVPSARYRLVLAIGELWFISSDTVKPIPPGPEREGGGRGR